MNIRWLFRMARWSHKPPSEKRVKFVFAIIAVCLVLFSIEYFVGWPDWLSMDPRNRNLRP